MSQPAVFDTSQPATVTQVAGTGPVGQPAQDHYPIVTPEGRFEVSQLSDRGLYRAQRYATAMAFSRTVSAPPAPSPQPAAEPAPRVLVYDAGDGSAAQEQADEPQLADASEARVIDVAAELAAR